MSKFLALLLTSLLVALAYGAEGDAYVYRVSNGYNNEVLSITVDYVDYLKRASTAQR